MRLVLAFILFFLTPSALWAELFSKGEIPDWVHVADIPQENQAHIAFASGGVYYLLFDTQIIWKDSKRLIASRLSTKVLNRSGLETAASLHFNVDPAYETLTLATLARIRDGVRTELKDQASFRQFQRETDLERGIIDGGQTLYYDMPDVRVGDIVDYIVIHEEQPRFKNATFSGRQTLGFSVPVGNSSLTLHWPADKPIYTEELAPEIAAQTVHNGETTTYRWSRGDIAPPIAEKEVPAGYNEWPYISYSESNDWADIGKTFYDYYNQPQTLPDRWQAKIRDIQRDHRTDAARLIAALRLVQDEIRYVGIEIGPGGYYARSPEMVIERGFGDCKDKSLLLKTILARLGIKSDVALANLDNGHFLNERLPSMNNFDHMIVRAKLHDKWFWMDPTASNQAGTLDTSEIPDYGYVLPLAANGESEGLVKITPNLRAANNVTTTEFFLFNVLGLMLGVETVYSGTAANGERSRWDAESQTTIQQQYFDYYNRKYRGLRLSAQTKSNDDPEANKFTITESYFLPQKALKQKDLYSDFQFGAESYLNYLYNLRADERRAPLAIPYYMSRTHRIVVKNAPIEFEPPDNISTVNPAFYFMYSGTNSEGGNMELTWRFGTKARQVEADRVDEVLREYHQMNDSRSWSWDFHPE